MIRPFFILGLPRSRTYWLSKFLTYRQWTCGHEELRHIRTMEDAKSWLSQPFTGSAETALAPFWRLLPKDARLVIIRRPVAEVKDSLLRLNLGDGGAFDPMALDGLLKRLDAKLDQIESRWRGPIIEVRYEGLNTENACKAIFEHCLPYDFDHEWWKTISQFNLQCSFAENLRYHKAHAKQILLAAKIAKQRTLSEMTLRKSSDMDGIEFSEESFDRFYEDGQSIFAEHAVEIGQPPDIAKQKNLPLYRLLDQTGQLQIVTARSNGRMFGYLMMELAPSHESPTRRGATQTLFYASKDAPGLGMRLEREAIARVRSKGISDVWGCSGDDGPGALLGTLYRRL